MMWGDFFIPLFAYGISFLLLSAGAAAFHRVRVWRLRKPAEPSVVVRLEQPVASIRPRDERRAA